MVSTKALKCHGIGGAISAVSCNYVALLPGWRPRFAIAVGLSLPSEITGPSSLESRDVLVITNLVVRFRYSVYWTG